MRLPLYYITGGDGYDGLSQSDLFFAETSRRDPLGDPHGSSLATVAKSSAKLALTSTPSTDHKI